MSRFWWEVEGWELRLSCDVGMCADSDKASLDYKSLKWHLLRTHKVGQAEISLKGHTEPEKVNKVSKYAYFFDCHGLRRVTHRRPEAQDVQSAFKDLVGGYKTSGVKVSDLALSKVEVCTCVDTLKTSQRAKTRVTLSESTHFSCAGCRGEKLKR